MPSIVNKVKDAMRGDRHSAEYTNEGDYDRRSQYGVNDNYGNNSHAGAQDQSRLMGAGQMNPTSSDNNTHGTSTALGTSGSYEPGFVTDHHRDGREYVPPKGTHVAGDTIGQSSYDQPDHTVVRQNTTGTRSHTPSNNRGIVDSRNLMDPASHDSQANIMGGPAVGVATGGEYDQNIHHNKLHKRDDSMNHHHVTHRKSIGADTYGKQGTGANLMSSTHNNDRDYDRESASALQRLTGQHHGSGSNMTPREAGDSRIGEGNTVLGGTTGLAHRNNQDHSRGNQSGFGTSSIQRGPTSTYGPSAIKPGVPSTFANAPSTGFSADHYGPGHPTSKVLHQCDHCGEDNDISHYFKKDTVYRIERR